MMNEDELGSAIDLLRGVVAQTNEQDERHSTTLKHLGVLLYDRGRLLGRDEDIAEAIILLQRAIRIGSPNQSDRAEWLQGLSNVFRDQFVLTRKAEHLESAIEMTKKAIEAIPVGRLDLEVRLTGILAFALHHRYKLVESGKNRREWICVMRNALKMTPNHSPDNIAWLGNLSMGLMEQYFHESKMDDLEEAIQLKRRQIRILPQTHYQYQSSLTDLSFQLLSRYTRSQNPDDLEEAIQLSRKAVAATLEDDPRLSERLITLIGALRIRFDSFWNKSDSDEAIQIAWRAIQVHTTGTIGYAEFYQTLASCLYDRYELLGKIEDLEKSIEIARRSLMLTPFNNYSLSLQRLTLAISLKSRYQFSKRPEDLECAIGFAREASKDKNNVPIFRVQAYNLTISLLSIEHDFQAAYNASLEAISLIPYLHTRSLDQRDQQHVVATFSGLTVMACSFALQVGTTPDIALGTLEQGRGLTLSLIMDERSYTSRLKVVNPELYSKYESLQTAVNQPLKKDAARPRGPTLSQLEKCIRNIQELPGFSQFCRKPTVREMQKYSEKGTIVFINITSLRSDAIIVDANAVTTLPLPRLQFQMASDWIDQKLTTFTLEDRGRKNKQYLRFLSWLWFECVKPVLQKLHHYMQVQDVQTPENLPRLWWVGNGLASQFPFHAAGDMSAGRTEATCYHVVSSYTPTIKALRHTRSSAQTTQPWSAVVISMPTTPGMDGILETERETSQLIASIKSLMQVRCLNYPNVESAMEQIRKCSIVHFLCHGVSDTVDPSRSSLILQKTKADSKEPQKDPLSVNEISRNHLAQARIAFLSACSTAQNEVKSLRDEVLHIVSAFQIAGFRHVIGCLWPSDDEVCQEVAKSFYAELSEGGIASFEDDRAIALALHNAVLKIRESSKYAKQPLLWAQYVHYGA